MKVSINEYLKNNPLFEPSLLRGKDPVYFKQKEVFMEMYAYAKKCETENNELKNILRKLDEEN